MIRIFAFLLLALLPLQALGAEGHGAAKAAADGTGAPGTNVDMPYLMAPITNADGGLTGYAYVMGQLTATSAGAVLAIRDKLAFIQDAFVREVNGKPVTLPDDPGQVDIPALQARLLADARKVMGAGKVKSYTVCTIQMAALRPKPQAAPVNPDAPPQKSRCTSQPAKD